jgi:nicotinamide mononucleotide (NMN) deamidase PncC
VLQDNRRERFEKPVGTVWIAVGDRQKVIRAKKINLSSQNRQAQY